jgi:hypothetical protein
MRVLASAKIRGAAPRGVAQRGESKRAYPVTVIGPPGRLVTHRSARDDRQVKRLR